MLNHVDALRPTRPARAPAISAATTTSRRRSPRSPAPTSPNLTKLRKGDVEKGFAEAEWIVEREYTNPSVQHVPLETHVAIVEWQVGDEVTIWTSAQSPFTVRNLFCHAFKLPLNNVRVVIVPHVGGGFGGKAGIHLEPLLACLSRKAGGRPVKFQATREEEFSLLPCRSALTYRIKTGVRSDGRITAQQMTMYWDAGAYADYAVNVTRASGYSAAGPYDIPNAWLDAYTIYTNKPYGTAYRGFGHVEFFWGLERHMELVARGDRHGPARVPAQEPAAAGLDHAHRRGDHRAHRATRASAWTQAAEAIGYGTLTDEEREYERRTGRRIGKGLATLHKAPAMPPFTATATVVQDELGRHGAGQPRRSPRSARGR